MPASAQILGTGSGWGGAYLGVSPGVKLGDATWTATQLNGGGIGSHILWNLAAMGVKKITVVDFDVVDESNLNRQLMYARNDVGQIKVHVLCSKIREFNPEIEITGGWGKFFGAEGAAEAGKK